MRLQALGIVFVIIIVPLILVLSYYLNLQIKTIAKQNEYDKSLLSATYDAVSSFEINTANEDLSTVSDSLRTIIEASANVFMNTLATNLGVSNASKLYVEPYVPALLYTLYDGYYIYAPTKVPKMFTDHDTGVAISIGDEGLKYHDRTFMYYSFPTAEQMAESGVTVDTSSYVIDIDVDFAEDPELMQYYGQQLYIAKVDDDGSYDETQCRPLEYYSNYNDAAPSETLVVTPNIKYADVNGKNVLKSYMPYSAKYIQDGEGSYPDRSPDINVSIIYTLDNYVTVEGYIDGIYYTKSGYIIPNSENIRFTTIKNEEKKPPGDFSDATFDYIKSCNQAEAKKYISDGHYVKLEIGDVEIVSGNRRAEVDDEGNYRTYLYYDSELNEYYYSYSDVEHRQENLTDIYFEAKNNYNSISKNPKEMAATVQAFFTKYSDSFENGGEGLVMPADTTGTGAFTNLESDPTKVQNIKEKLAEFMEKIFRKLQDIQYTLDKASAISYYADACIFTNWITDNNIGLGKLRENSLVEISRNQR